MVNVNGFLVAFHSHAISCMAQSERETSKTRCASGPRPILFPFHATSCHRAKFLDSPLYRSSTDLVLRPLVAQSRSPRRTAQTSKPCGQINKTKHHCQTKTDSWPRPHVPHPLLRDKQEKCSNSINNFFGLQPKRKTAPKYIATLIHKNKQRKENKRVQQQKT